MFHININNLYIMINNILLFFYYIFIIKLPSFDTKTQYRMSKIYLKHLKIITLIDEMIKKNYEYLVK